MPVTLRDIAERTGVSPSVVSTVLSGRENGTFVSETTRQRVLVIAKQLNYVPVRSGRPRGSRRLRRLHAEQFIGVWAPLPDRVSLNITSELQQALTDFIATEPLSEGSDGLGLRLISDAELPRLDTLGLMGLIVVGDVALPRAAAAASIPTVQIGEPDTLSREVVGIHANNFSAGQALGNYLWDLGHRRFAFVAPASRPRVTRHRWQGLQSVWVEHGAVHTDCVPSPYDMDKQGPAALGAQVDIAVRRLYVAEAGVDTPAPTAVVAFDESVAAFVLQSLHRLGKNVPGDVSVVTFGDTQNGAEAMSPPVTAYRLPLAAIAKAAVRELYARAEAATAETSEDRASAAAPVGHKFHGELIERDSSAAPFVA